MKRRRVDRINSVRMKRLRFDRITFVLPDDIMLEIFRYLDWKDREASSLVCKRWLNLVRLSRETIRIGCSDGTDALIKLLSDRFFNVRDVFINESHVLPPAALYKSELDEMGKCCLSDTGLAAVGGAFTKLKSLKLTCCWNVTDVGLIAIAEKCKLLKSLDLQDIFVGDKSLAAIAKYCTQLEDLNLKCCGSLTDNGFVQLALSRGRTLKSLGLVFGKRLTDVSLEAVGFHCISLQTLSIESEFINNKGLLSIAKGCSLLKSLKLRCQNITDEVFQAVGNFCLSLELLALRGCKKLTDKSLFAIGKGCKRLKSLSLEYCQTLSDLGLDSIAVGCVELTCLEVLSCYRIGGLNSIARACIRLSKLVVRHDMLQQIDFDGLSEITSFGDEALCGMTRGCRNLKKLNISHCTGVGNEGIISVSRNCKFLTDLILSFCDQVGDAGMVAIARACPQLSLLRLNYVKKLGDKGISSIGVNCPLLEYLDISGCEQITDIGLGFIARNCKLLESCHMMSCYGISRTGVATLISRCPKIKSVLVEEFKSSQRDEIRVLQGKSSSRTRLRVRQRRFSARTK